jgi:Rrf2 family protein
MRITQEADYAIRICAVLDSFDEKTGAAEIAEKACITQRFALKILGKLVETGIVKSFKGAFGGYVLTVDGDELKIIDVIEAIEGPMKISKCLECDHDCSRNPNKTCCNMHLAFEAINKNLVDSFGKITVRMLNDKSIGAEDISDIINK